MTKTPTKTEYITCEHDYPSYKWLLSLCSKQHTYLKKQDKVLKKLEARLVDYHEAHTDCLEKNQELLKDHIEITRAYNGLHHMGKFAEEYTAGEWKSSAHLQNKKEKKRWRTK